MAFGGKIVNIVVNGVKLVVKFTKDGLVRIGELAKSFAALTVEQVKKVLRALNLLPEEEAMLLIERLGGNVDEVFSFVKRGDSMVWLEKGVSGSKGLVHIIESHWHDFVRKFGVQNQDELIELVNMAIKNGSTSPNQPSGSLYTYIDEFGRGVKVYTGSNGYIIGAHPF